MHPPGGLLVCLFMSSPHVAVTFWSECAACKARDEKFSQRGLRAILSHFDDADIRDTDGSLSLGTSILIVIHLD